jgi:hypothetical protein
MAPKWLLLFLFGLFSVLASASHAATIHVRYFESADFLLLDDRFQLYSFAALEDEQVTLVVYGLDEGLIPAVSVFDINGVTVTEDLNLDQRQVAVIELTAPENGLYTALVSRQSEGGGLVRVMLFEGQPLEPDFSLLDTIDPLLPSRAYFAQGDSQSPVSMTVSVLEDEDDNTPLPQIFASRGTQLTPPPLEERLTAIERFSWQNDDGSLFYTLNVRSIPEEALPTSRKVGAFLAANAQFLDLATIRLDIGEGSADPDFLPRLECLGQAQAGASLLAGPGEQFIVLRSLTQRTEVEVIGSSGDFWLIVDPTSPFGGSFIRQDDLEITADENACARALLTFAAPNPTPDNTINNRPSGGTTAGFGLTPDGGNPSDAPNQNPNDVLRFPPAPPSASSPEFVFPSIGCMWDGAVTYIDFGGGFSLFAPPPIPIYNDPGCTSFSGNILVPIVYAPSGYNPSELCMIAFGLPTATPFFTPAYQCS